MKDQSNTSLSNPDTFIDSHCLFLLFKYWWCKEKINAGHSWELEGWSEHFYQHYLLVSNVDCEQSLFFFRFSEGSARARERRAAKPRDARNDGGARSYLRLSCVLLDGPRKKRDCSQSSLRCGGWFWFRTVQRRLIGYHSTLEKGSEIYLF